MSIQENSREAENISLNTGLKTPPLVSVIIPYYNRADLVEETIQSVFAQTFKDFELIIVNDGSPDTPLFEETLKKFTNQNLVYVVQENAGVSFARNNGISHAKGEILAFLDSDDIWEPEYLASQVKFLQENNLSMCYCNALLFDNPTFEGQTYMDGAKSIGEVSTVSMLKADCNVITSGTLLRKEVIDKVGGFDHELTRSSMEDFDLWFRVVHAGYKVSYQKKVLLKYRVRMESLSGDNIQRIKRTIFALRNIEKKFDLTSIEQKVVDNSSRRAEANLNLEIGKAHLLKHEYAQAKECFKLANQYLKSTKLTVINLLVAISPQFLLKIFRYLRADEIPYILGK